MPRNADELHDATGNLRVGSYWAEHEDYLVGDEEGLRHLIRACEAALQSGEYRGAGLADFLGVRKIPTTAFTELNKADTTGGTGILVLAVAAILVLLLLGLYQLYDWVVL